MARFAERSLGRHLAAQFLFGLEFVDTDWETALELFWDLDPLALNVSSFESDEAPVQPMPRVSADCTTSARGHAHRLIEGVRRNTDALDTELLSALEHWKPERVGRIEWVILRLALYEMRHCPDVPATVVISEWLNVVGVFGDKDAARFINGILHRLMHEEADDALNITTADEQ